MARIRNLKVYKKWHIFQPGLFARVDIDLDAVESASAGGVTAAAAAAVTPILPWGPFVAAVLTAHAAQISANKGPLGTTVRIKTPVVELLPIPFETSISYSKIGGEGSLIKVSGRPEVFVVQAGQRRWITSPAVFNANNFAWSAIVSVSDTELNSIPGGPDLT